MEKELKAYHLWHEMSDLVFTLAMIDMDNGTEHDHALLEDSIERAKKLYKDLVKYESE